MRSTSRSTSRRTNRTADPRRTPWPEHSALRLLIARGPEAPTLKAFEAQPRGTRKSGTRPCRLRAIVPQTGFSSADHCLRPIRYLQLQEDVRDVVSHRLETHVQLPGYLLVALALRHEREDLLFALGQLREEALLPGPWDGEEAHDAFGYPGAEDSLTASYGPDGVHHPLASGVFQEVPLGPSAHSG